MPWALGKLKSKTIQGFTDGLLAILTTVTPAFHYYERAFQ
jgi:hypothetical protein